MPLRLERLTGTRIGAHQAALAELRITVFRAFPYLYEGSLAYEAHYLALYADTPGSVVIGAFDGDRLVGAATAVPLLHEDDAIVEPVRAHGLDPKRTLYYGRSVLLLPIVVGVWASPSSPSARRMRSGWARSIMPCSAP